MFQFIALIITLAAVVFGFSTSRRFVRDRLRYVDAVRKPHIPFVVGFIAALIAVPVAMFLPLVGLGTALALGMGVGFGVAAGNRDVRRAEAGSLIVRG